MTVENHCYIIDRFGQPKYIDFLVHGLIPRTGVGVLYGQSQTGKSLLCMRLAASIATGVSAAINYDYPDDGRIHHRGATIYFAGEGESGLMGRISAAETAVRHRLEETPEEYLPIISMGIGHHKLNEADQLPQIIEMLRQKVEDYKAYDFPVRLIIFDTLTACFSIQDENSNSEMQRVVSALQAFSKAYDCFVLVVAHPAKSTKNKTSGTRGAGTLTNSADVVLRLNAVNRSPMRRLTVEKMRDGGSTKHAFSYRLTTFSNLPALLPDEEAPKTDKAATSRSTKETSDTQKRILAAIEQSESKRLDRKGVQEILAPLKANNSDSANAKKKRGSVLKDINRSLLYLIQAGSLTQDEAGYYSPVASEAKAKVGDEAAPKVSSSAEVEEEGCKEVDSKRKIAGELFFEVRVEPPPTLTY